MAGLVTATHDVCPINLPKPWMTGTGPVMTVSDRRGHSAMEIKSLHEPLEASDSDLGRSSFKGVMMMDATFHDAGLHSIRFDYVNMSDAHFSRMNLSRSVFDDGLLPGARFTNVNLSGACFDNVNMAGGMIKQASLAGLSITDSNIAGMRVDGILISEAIAAYRKTA
jgi:uncharacterized protein YjbI with pentapeptide repeats